MIPVSEPLLNGNEEKYVLECIRSGWISAEGPSVAAFEQAFAQKIARKHAICVCNGSLALDAAVVALGLGPGDEVILPTFTIISCAAAVIRAGATPVVVDCDPLTWNMDADQVGAAVTSRTRAILIAHIYGLPVDLDPILQVADRYGLLVIEDAAEMLGQSYKGRPCGSFGQLSTFSFYANKTVTTGEGGMIVTDDEEVAERCRQLRNLCFGRQNRFVHENLGWNLRMGSIQAALGLAQLERLDEAIERKRAIGNLYNVLLNDVSDIQLPQARTDYAENIYWVYGIVLQNESRISAESAMKELRKLGVATRPFFWPMHQQPVFRRMGLFENQQHPISEYIARHGFYIPSGLTITDDQIRIVSQSIKRVLQ